MSQIELHKQIDELVKRGPSPELDVDSVVLITSRNFDAKNYFFAQADERWIDWLLSNGFIEVIKDASESTKTPFYPELDYLTRVATKDPDKVVSVILSVESSEDAFNPIVLERFLFIASHLPPKHLKSLVQKIHLEGWVKLMGGLNNWSFEYEKILDHIFNENDYSSILLLAEEMLSVRQKTETGANSDNPFYFNELSGTKLFKYLADIGDGHTEEILSLLIKVMGAIVALGESRKEKSIFTYSEAFHLYDIDFFTVEPGHRRHLSHRDDVVELAALMKLIIKRLIEEKHERSEEIRRVYARYIVTLPDSASMYRLRLFVLSLCPEVLVDDIRQALFRIFEYDDPYELTMGPEYKRLIQSSLKTLSEEDKRKYVSEVITKFSKVDDAKFIGRKLLSSAYPLLLDSERQRAEAELGVLDASYQPEPLIGQVRGGMVMPQPPGDESDWQGSIESIVEKLKSSWSPEKLKESLNSDEDFLRPKNAEGVGDRLKKEIENRFDDYIVNAGLFFKRDGLHPHYTYSYLRGVADLLRNNKVPKGPITPVLFDLIDAIHKSGQASPFEDTSSARDHSGWLGQWNTVHKVMAEILKQLLTGENDALLINFSSNRDLLLANIEYLLGFFDPKPEDEQIESAKIKAGDPSGDGYLPADPYTAAINSVRGEAFMALMSFIYFDGKRLDPKGKIISEDVKRIYEKVLIQEKTQALMFLFGHHAPAFYFRDLDWFKKMLPHIFCLDSGREHLYLAAWEGYLANNLYQEIFLDPIFQTLYERAVLTSAEGYPKRRYFKDLDEGLANHLALAFVYYREFGLDTPLFKSFWQRANEGRHAEFIGLIGRLFVSGGNSQAGAFSRADLNTREKLMSLWDWVLNNCDETKTLQEFGAWIDIEKQIFDVGWLAEKIKKTLYKTEGVIDWNYGLIKMFPSIINASPQTALEILRLNILVAGVRKGFNGGPFYMRDEWMRSFKMLYADKRTKSGVYGLINELIAEGGSMFWPLKEILENE